MKKSIGEKIELIRGKSTREEFESKTAISSSTLRNIERRGTEPGYDILKRITTHQDYYPYTLWLMTDKTSPDAGQYEPGREQESKDVLLEGDDLDYMQIIIEAVESQLQQLPAEQRYEFFTPAKLAKIMRFVVEQILKEKAQDNKVDMANVIQLHVGKVLDLVA